MQPPSSPRDIKNFQFQDTHENEDQFLPLMETNNKFLYAAIIEGLINRVIWVKPDWSMNKKTEVRRGHVGTMRHKGKEIFCFCEQCIHGNKLFPLVCKYHNHELRNFTRTFEERCKKYKTYRFIETTESNLTRLVHIKSRVSLFVDIDEDFFGVESGIDHFIREGISLRTQKVLDVILPRLYSVKSPEEERELDNLMRVLFTRVADLVSRSRDHPRKDVVEMRARITKAITDNTQQFFRDPDEVNELSIFLSSLKHEHLVSLSRAKYCLRSIHTLGRYDEMDFTLCHGHTNLEEKLKHISSKDAILKRGQNLQEILHFLYQSSAPRFFTVSRSLRDGYTPRDQQQYIERMVLGSIIRAIQSSGRRKRVVYDSHLSFGKKGWEDEDTLRYRKFGA